MYSYTFTDDESKKINQKTDALSELEKNLEKIDQKYDLTSEVNPDDYNKTLSLERMEFDDKTDEEVEKEAKTSLSEFENQSKQAIEQDYQTSKKAVEDDLETLQENTAKSKQSLQDAFTSAKTEASNDAIKRGLARSSIIANKLASYDNQMLEKFVSIEKDYLETSQGLTSQKNLLEVQRQNALSSFDISYAVKLSEKINSIGEQLFEKEKEVIEYNNKMETLEKEYEQEMLEKLQKAKEQADKDNLEYMEYINKYGTGKIETAKNQEKYDVALAYLSSIPKAQALYELQNNSLFSKQLKANYNVLVEAIKNRND